VAAEKAEVVKAEVDLEGDGSEAADLVAAEKAEVVKAEVDLEGDGSEAADLVAAEKAEVVKAEVDLEGEEVSIRGYSPANTCSLIASRRLKANGSTS
jgi:hypothetical protein